jgi:hypothetical protein
MVEEIKDIERKKRLNFSLVTRKNNPAHDDVTMDLQDWFRVCCVKSVIAAEYGALLDETTDEHKKRRIYHNYWEQYLADAVGKPALMTNVEGALELGMTASAKAEIRSEIRVEQKIDAELLHDLKKYSRQNRIELDTLGVAAWSVLMSRIAKSPQPLFPIKRRLSTPFTEQNNSRYEVFPLLVNTMVRSKCGDWLSALQARIAYFCQRRCIEYHPDGFPDPFGPAESF